MNFLLKRNWKAKNHKNNITDEAWEGSEKKKVNLEKEVLPVNKKTGNNSGANEFSNPVTKNIKTKKYTICFIS